MATYLEVPCELLLDLEDFVHVFSVTVSFVQLLCHHLSRIEVSLLSAA